MAAVFMIVACLIHFRGFHAPMIYDSEVWILAKKHIFSRYDPLQAISLYPGRPLYTLTLYLNYVAGGMDPFLYRVVNALILGLSGLILTVLTTFVLEIPGLGVGGNTTQKRLVAAFVGLLFVVHPLQSFVVLYIWQRSVIMACLFYFSSFAVYVALRSGRVREPVPAYLLIMMCFLGAMLSKEIAVTLPFVLLLSEITLFRSNIRQLAKQGIVIVLITLPPLIFYVLALHTFHGTESSTPAGIIARLLRYYEVSGVSLLQVSLTECRVLFSYLSMIVLPGLVDVELIRAEIISTSFLNPPSTLFAVIGLVGLLGFGLAAVRKMPVLAFGLLFYVGALLPEAILEPNYLFFGYRPILPMAGVLLAFSWVAMCLVAWSQTRSGRGRFKVAGFVAGGLVLSFFSAQTVLQAMNWNPLQFWREAYRRLPVLSNQVEVIPYLDTVINYSHWLVESGEYDKAIAALAKSGLERSTINRGADKTWEAGSNFDIVVRKNPERAAGALLNLGLALKKSGNVMDAVKYYRLAVQVDPLFAQGYNNLGLALEETGELAPALTAFTKAVRLLPKSPVVNYNHANVLLKTGHLEEAVRRYRISLALDPGSVKAYANLGVAQLRSGRFAEAVTSLKKALPSNKRNAELHNALGVAYAELGKTSEAVELFRKALDIQPDHPGAAQNLRNVLSGQQQNSAPSESSHTPNK